MKKAPAWLSNALNALNRGPQLKDPEQEGQLNVEALEPRMMLSAVSLVEGETGSYSTTVSGLTAAASYEVRVDLGNGTESFEHFDFVVDDSGGSAEVSIDNIQFLYADDGDFDATIEVLGDGAVIGTTNASVSVENVAPDVTVAGWGGETAAGSTYFLQFAADDPGDDTISNWSIDWGDGTTQMVAGDAEYATHIYTLPGDAEITVTAIDEDGVHTPTKLSRTLGFGEMGQVVDDRGVSQTPIQSVEYGGGVLIMGTQTTDGVESTFLRLFDASGTPYEAFGVDGTAVLNIDGSGSFTATGLATQSTGQIILFGDYSIGGNASLAMVRYNVDGTMDTEFGAENADAPGVVVVDITATGVESASAIAVRGDEIILTGIAESSPGQSDYVVAKFNSEGEFNTDFAETGWLTGSFSTTGESVNGIGAVQLLDDHSILILGESDNVVGQSVELARYATDGTLDTNFGTDGIMTLAANGSGVQLSRTNTGETLVLATEESDGDLETVIFKLTSTGELATDFGIAGKSTIDLDPNASAIQLEQLVDGSIAILVNNDGNHAIFKTKLDGTLDDSFGELGMMQVDDSSGVGIHLTSDWDLLTVSYDSTDSGQSNVVLTKSVSSDDLEVVETIDASTTRFALPAAVATTLDEVIAGSDSLGGGVWRPDLDNSTRQWDNYGVQASEYTDWSGYVIDDSLEEFDLADSAEDIGVSMGATGVGYILFSETSLNSRLGIVGNDHLIAVQHDGTGWQYNDGMGWQSFTTDASDVLIAELDFDAGTVTSLEGESGEVHGITRGHVGGDIAITQTAGSGGGTLGGGPGAGVTYEVSGSTVWTGDKSALGNGTSDNSPTESRRIESSESAGGYMLYQRDAIVDRSVGDNADGELAETVTTTITTSYVWTDSQSTANSLISSGNIGGMSFTSSFSVTTTHTFTYVPKTKLTPLAVAISTYEIVANYTWEGDRSASYTSRDGSTTTQAATYDTSGTLHMSGIARVYGSAEEQPDGTIEESYVGSGTGAGSIQLRSNNLYASTYTGQYMTGSSSGSDDYRFNGVTAYQVNGAGEGLTQGNQWGSSSPTQDQSVDPFVEGNAGGYVDNNDGSGRVQAAFAGGTGTVSGTIWNDADQNGIRDTSEGGLAGVSVMLWSDADGDGEAESVVGIAQTAADGSYQFNELQSSRTLDDGTTEAIQYRITTSPQRGGKLTTQSVERQVNAESGASDLFTLDTVSTHHVDAGMYAESTTDGYTNFGNDYKWGNQDSGDGGTDGGGSNDPIGPGDDGQPSYNISWTSGGLMTVSWYDVTANSSFSGEYNSVQSDSFTSNTVTGGGSYSGSSSFVGMGYANSLFGFDSNAEGGIDTSGMTASMDIGQSESSYTSTSGIKVENEGKGVYTAVSFGSGVDITGRGNTTSQGTSMFQNSTASDDPEGDLHGVMSVRTGGTSETSVTTSSMFDFRTADFVLIPESPENGDDPPPTGDDGSGGGGTDGDIDPPPGGGDSGSDDGEGAETETTPEIVWERVENQEAIDAFKNVEPENYARLAFENGEGEGSGDAGNPDGSGDPEPTTTPPQGYEKQITDYYIYHAEASDTVNSKTQTSATLGFHFLEDSATELNLVSGYTIEFDTDSSRSSVEDEKGTSGEFENKNGSYAMRSASQHSNSKGTGTSSGSSNLSNFSSGQTGTSSESDDPSTGDPNDGLNTGGGGTGSNDGAAAGGGDDSGSQDPGTTPSDDERKDGTTGTTSASSTFSLTSGISIADVRSEGAGSYESAVDPETGDFSKLNWFNQSQFTEKEIPTSANSSSSTEGDLNPGKTETENNGSSDYASGINGNGTYKSNLTYESQITTIPDNTTGGDGDGSDSGGLQGTGSSSIDPVDDNEPIPESNLIKQVDKVLVEYETDGDLKSVGSVLNGQTQLLKSVVVDNDVFGDGGDSDDDGSDSGSDDGLNAGGGEPGGDPDGGGGGDGTGGDGSDNPDAPVDGYEVNKDNISVVTSGSSTLNNTSSYSLSPETTPNYKLSQTTSSDLDYQNGGFVRDSFTLNLEGTNDFEVTVSDSINSKQEFKQDGIYLTADGERTVTETGSAQVTNGGKTIESSRAVDDGEGSSLTKTAKIEANDYLVTYSDTTTTTSTLDDYGRVLYFAAPETTDPDTNLGGDGSSAQTEPVLESRGTGKMTVVNQSTGDESLFTKVKFTETEANPYGGGSREDNLEIKNEAGQNSWNLTDTLEIAFADGTHGYDGNPVQDPGDTPPETGSSQIKYTIDGSRNWGGYVKTNGDHAYHYQSQGVNPVEGKTWAGSKTQTGSYSSNTNHSANGTRTGTITAAFDGDGNALSAGGTQTTDYKSNATATAGATDYVHSFLQDRTDGHTFDGYETRTTDQMDKFDFERKSSRTAKVTGEGDEAKLDFDISNTTSNHVTGNQTITEDQEWAYEAPDGTVQTNEQVVVNGSADPANPNPRSYDENVTYEGFRHENYGSLAFIGGPTTVGAMGMFSSAVEEAPELPGIGDDGSSNLDTGDGEDESQSTSGSTDKVFHDIRSLKNLTANSEGYQETPSVAPLRLRSLTTNSDGVSELPPPLIRGDRVAADSFVIENYQNFTHDELLLRLSLDYYHRTGKATMLSNGQEAFKFEIWADKNTALFVQFGHDGELIVHRDPKAMLTYWHTGQSLKFGASTTAYALTMIVTEGTIGGHLPGAHSVGVFKGLSTQVHKPLALQAPNTGLKAMFRGRLINVETRKINLRNGVATEKGSGLNYALRNHGHLLNGGPGQLSKSKFSISAERLKEILVRKDVVGSPLRQSGTTGNYIREVDVGEIVGHLPLNKGGELTRIITVITDVKGNLVNTFPGRLGRAAN